MFGSIIGISIRYSIIGEHYWYKYKYSIIGEAQAILYTL